jgi:hypothetical protein
MHGLWITRRTSIIELMSSHPWDFRNTSERNRSLKDLTSEPCRRFESCHPDQLEEVARGYNSDPNRRPDICVRTFSIK